MPRIMGLSDNNMAKYGIPEDSSKKNYQSQVACMHLEFTEVFPS